MANSIVLFKKYIDLLDEVYQNASCSSVLDGDKTMVKAGVNANEIVIPKIKMDGLADYSRTSGYVQGNVTIEYETVQFNYDRGRKFTVDAMDNVETAGIAFGKLSAEFIRTKTVPELDAFRFATYAAAPNILKVAVGTELTTGEAVLNAVSAAQNEMDEHEVSTENRFLFITPTLLRLAESVDTTKSKAVLDDFAKIVKVPQKRFSTAIELYDGSAEGEEAGGYVKAEGASDINFMIIEKSAVIQYSKHTVNKVITPEANQNDDGWAFFFRDYGLADYYENKTDGIYLHHK
ncbi:MAG: hypothetical protein IJ007_06235 [Oscillospiraceae bacterium]|nr:hypothetical protein [Oscillospiraceae bacterium]